MPIGILLWVLSSYDSIGNCNDNRGILYTSKDNLRDSRRYNP